MEITTQNQIYYNRFEALTGRIEVFRVFLSKNARCHIRIRQKARLTVIRLKYLSNSGIFWTFDHFNYK